MHGRDVRQKHLKTQLDQPCCQCYCPENQEEALKMRLRSSLSRSKSRKRGRKEPLGVMERNVYQNLHYYKTLHATNTTNKNTSPNNTSKTRIQTHKNLQGQQQHTLYASIFPNEAELRPKPVLNDKSKKLYEKVRRERRLSPNVFDRLQADQEQRSRSKVVSIVQRIRDVTPNKKITLNDLEKVSTPKQMRYFQQYLNLPSP